MAALHTLESKGPQSRAPYQSGLPMVFPELSVSGSYCSERRTPELPLEAKGCSSKYWVYLPKIKQISNFNYSLLFRCPTGRLIG